MTANSDSADAQELRLIGEWVNESFPIDVDPDGDRIIRGADLIDSQAAEIARLTSERDEAYEWKRLAQERAGKLQVEVARLTSERDASDRWTGLVCQALGDAIEAAGIIDTPALTAPELLMHADDLKGALEAGRAEVAREGALRAANGRLTEALREIKWCVRNNEWWPVVGDDFKGRIAALLAGAAPVQDTGPTVEIGGQSMTQAQFDAARYPLLNPSPGPVQETE